MDAAARRRSSRQTVSATLRNLVAGTVYHYRVVAKNTLGTTSGDDRTFKTKPKTKPKKS